jgi:hypothetical protein
MNNLSLKEPPHAQERQREGIKRKQRNNEKAYLIDK